VVIHAFYPAQTSVYLDRYEARNPLLPLHSTVMGKAKKTIAMKGINYRLIFYLLIVSQIRTYATSQIPDLLIYNGDTLSIFANPLEQLYENDSIRPNFFGDKEGCMSTACWRGYEAEWTIVDNELYLTGIYSCCYYEDSIKANLKMLFGDKVVSGKVRADWFTGKIIAPQGELLYYIHMGYESLYERELELDFSNGKLIGIKTYDNSKSRQSEFSQKPEKLKEFIYSNINWRTLPKFDNKTIKVFVQFSANENGLVDSVKVMRGYDSIFDNEAIRVIKTIPDWDIYYRHGKLQRMNWTFPVVFNDENRNKYWKENNDK
jgi:hypothetical protein